MVNKHYPPEFKAGPVALYRSRPGATIASIADDLGVSRETLRSWVRLGDERRGGGLNAAPLIAPAGHCQPRLKVAAICRPPRPPPNEDSNMRTINGWVGRT